MTIYEELESRLKKAMLEKNDWIKQYIRNIKSKVTEYQVANNLDRTEKPNDELMVKIMSSYVKSLNKALEMLNTEDAIDLIVEYRGEIAFCQHFLPDESENTEEIERLVDEAIQAVGQNVGKIMGYIMKSNKSLDGAAVKSVVLKKLG